MDLQANNWRASLFFDQEDDDWSQMEQVLDMSEEELNEEMRGQNGEV